MPNPNKPRQNKGGCKVGRKDEKPKGGCKVGKRNPTTKEKTVASAAASKAKAKKKAEPKKRKFNVKPAAAGVVKSKAEKKARIIKKIREVGREQIAKKKKKKADFTAPAKPKAKAKAKAKSSDTFISDTRSKRGKFMDEMDEEKGNTAAYTDVKAKKGAENVARFFADHAKRDAAEAKAEAAARAAFKIPSFDVFKASIEKEDYQSGFAVNRGKPFFKGAMRLGINQSIGERSKDREKLLMGKIKKRYNTLKKDGVVRPDYFGDDDSLQIDARKKFGEGKTVQELGRALEESLYYRF